jgi:hypothetical protein
MNKISGIVSLCALIACGGTSSGNNATTPPTPTTYSFGTGTPVQSGTEQATAASTAQSSTAGIVSANASGVTSNNATALSEAPDLPTTITAELGEALIALPDPVAKAVAGGVAKASKNALESGCFTVSGNTITYNNCNLSDSGFSFEVDGTLTATPSNITWNINATESFSSANESINFKGTETGDLSFTTTSGGGSVDGQATTGFAGTESASGDTINFAYTAQVTFKSLAWSNSCDGFFTGGAMDVTVTVAVNGSQPNETGFENLGLEFTWTGCDSLLVATGTPH